MSTSVSLLGQMGGHWAIEYNNLLLLLLPVLHVLSQRLHSQVLPLLDEYIPTYSVPINLSSTLSERQKTQVGDDLDLASLTHTSHLFPHPTSPSTQNERTAHRGGVSSLPDLLLLLLLPLHLLSVGTLFVIIIYHGETRLS